MPIVEGLSFSYVLHELPRDRLPFRRWRFELWHGDEGRFAMLDEVVEQWHVHLAPHPVDLSLCPQGFDKQHVRPGLSVRRAAP